MDLIFVALYFSRNLRLLLLQSSSLAVCHQLIVGVDAFSWMTTGVQLEQLVYTGNQYTTTSSDSAAQQRQSRFYFPTVCTQCTGSAQKGIKKTRLYYALR